MPVTFKVANHDALTYTPLHNANRAAGTEAVFLREASANQYGRLVQSSLTFGDPNTAHLIPRSNGFVHTVLDAYARHHHLRIRPDDVWLAILTQLSFYVNAHAEELRQYFVSHEGQRTLEIEANGKGTPGWPLDCADMARQFAQKIHENVVDSTLAEWILPDFTTTTIHDRTVCSVVMMSTLKAYFEYFSCITCGIPSVTLDGTKSDWEEVYHRTYRLYELGPEPSVWAEMLRPILRRFVNAFDGKPDVDFWHHVLYHAREMCGQDDLSGWITAFCVWNSNGTWRMKKMPDVIPQKPDPPPRIPRPTWTDQDETSSRKGSEKPSKRRLSRISTQVKRLIGSRSKKIDKAAPPEVTKPGEKSLAAGTNARTGTASEISSELDSLVSGNGSTLTREQQWGPWTYILDGVEFPTIDFEDVPPGYCEVDVTLDNDRMITTCTMLAGHLGYSVSSRDPEGPLDTIQPSSHWFLVEKK